MPQDPHEEFAAAVIAAVGSVHQLYRQIDRLNSDLREALQAGPDRLSVLASNALKPGKDKGMRVIRDAYGLLLGRSDGFETVEEEDDDGDADTGEDAEGDEESSKRRKKKIQLNQAPCMAVRVLVYDPDEPPNFVPQVLFAPIGVWGLEGRTARPETLELAYSRAARIPHVLRPGLQAGKSLTTRARTVGNRRASGERVTCHALAEPASVPLFQLDGSGEVERLCTDIKNAWHQAASRGT
jgi:hypothetical protein